MWLAWVSFCINAKVKLLEREQSGVKWGQKKRTAGGGVVASWRIKRGEWGNGRGGPTYWCIGECDAASGREMDKVTCSCGVPRSDVTICSQIAWVWTWETSTARYMYEHVVLVVALNEEPCGIEAAPG